MIDDVEAGFIEAMAEAPEDPGPRIVFADWLLERGDPRGDYFRLHHEVNYGKPSTVVEKRFAKIARREQRRLAPYQYGGSFAHDGLLSLVEVPVATFLTDAARLFSLGPIHVVRLTHANGRLAELARFPPLRWVLGLELAMVHLTADDANLLAASPHLLRVRRVTVQGNVLGAAGVAGFAALPALTALDIARSNLAGDVSTLLPEKLQSLALASNDVDGKAVERLLGAARQLRHLDLSFNPIGVTGAHAIAAATHLDRLQTLALQRCRLDDAGVIALANAPRLDKLRTLVLDDNGLGPSAAAALMATPHFRLLRELRLEDNHHIPWNQRMAIVQRFTRD